MNGFRPYLLLGLLALALYAPGLWTLPVTDRDEARFAQASRQMVESGDWVRIRFQEAPRHKKPVGAYWLQAAAAAALSDAESAQIWPYRVPSALAAALAVMLVFVAGRTLFDTRVALVGAAILASSLLLVVEAHIAKADAALLAAVVGAQAALARIYMRARERRDPGLWAPLVFWAALGAGILIKGPIAPLVAGLTIVTLKLADRRVRWRRALRPLVGLPLAAAVVAPWAVAVSLATDGAFLADAVGGDLWPKLIAGQEAHGFPPGYYLALVMLTLWPGSLMLVPGLLSAWRERADPGVLFCLAWAGPAWLVFEVVPTKLPHYVLPLYPALALLAARAAVTRGPRLRGAGAWAARAAFGLWAVVGLGVAAGALAVAPALDGHFDRLALIPAAAAAVLVGAGLWLAWRGRMAPAAAAAVVLAPLVFAPLFHAVLPALEAPWLSRGVARAVARQRTEGAPPPVVAASGYHEPSLVFLLGTGTRLVTPEGAAAHLGLKRAAFALVGADQEARFLGATLSAAPPRPLERISGLNYSKGRWLTLTLYGPGGRPP